MKRPVFLALLMAGGVAFGAALDHGWQAYAGLDGAQCDFVAPRHAAALPLAQADPVRTAAVLPVTAPCEGGLVAADGTVSGSDRGGSGGRSALRPDCPGAAVVPAPAVHADPLPEARQSPAALAVAPISHARAVEESEESGIKPVLAIGAVLALLGLAAMRLPAGGRKRRQAAVLGADVALALAAEPLPSGPAELAMEFAADPAPSPFAADPVAAPFADDPIASSQRKAIRGNWSKPARKPQRRIAYALLAAGAVAAIAVMTARGPVARTAGDVSNTMLARARAVLPLGQAADPEGDAFSRHGIGKSRSALAASRQPTVRGLGRRGLPGDPGDPGDQVRADGDPARQGQSGTSQFDALGDGGTTVSDLHRGQADGGVSGGGGAGGGGAGGGGGGGGGTTVSGPGSSGSTGGSGGSGGSGGNGNNGSGNGSGDGSGSGAGGNGGAGSGLPETSPNPGDLVGTDPNGSGSGAVDVPEPDTLGLLALGIAGIVVGRSRRQRQRLARHGSAAVPVEEAEAPAA